MATKVLILLNILVMVVFAVKNPVMLLVPQRQSLIDFGANFGLITLSGQQWRLFTSLFLHVGILHLLVNLYALYKVGPPAEQLFGWRTLLIIYLFSGLLGSLASCLWNPMLVSAGASGAIFGVYGSLLAFMYVQRQQYPRKTLQNHALMAVCFVMCNLICGWMMPEIDNFAHFGGLFSGAFSGFLFAQLQVKERYRTAYSVPILVLLTGAMAVITQIVFDRQGFPLYYQGVQAMKHNHFSAAVDLFTRFITLHPNDADAYGSRAICFDKLGSLQKAFSDFCLVIALEPKSAESYNSRAWVECGLKQYDQSVTDASRAIQLNPHSSAAYDTRGYAYSHKGDLKNASADFEQAIKLTPKDPAPHYHRAKNLRQISTLAPAPKDYPEIAGRYQPESWED